MAEDNKPAKYVRYAIGEIALVVIGILIALQINNWNQHRIQQSEETKLLQTLLKDLYLSEKESVRLIEIDQASFDSFQYFLSGENARQKLVTHPKIDSIFNTLIWSSVNTNIPAINSYADLKNAGKTGLISNENIRIRFTALENKLNALDKIVNDRFSVQILNIDGFALKEINFVRLLKNDKTAYKIDYGIENDYDTLFKNQFVLNAVAAKLELTQSVIDDRKKLLLEIQELITAIETEIKNNN